MRRSIRDPAENAVHEGSSLDGGDVTLLAQQELLTDERRDYVSFTVYGDAKPGGSKKAFQHPHTGRIIVVEDSKNKPWRQEVAKAGLAVVPTGGAPLFSDGPLGVEFVFYRPRPLAHYRTNGEIRDRAPAYPTTRPDVLKLARAVEDALTGILWRDDSQIVDERLLKRWGEPGRVEIGVWRVV
jgi:crossover junction endodeoxyribonuclease RusA